jgi:cytochrome c oxidase accessory protein FixG
MWLEQKTEGSRNQRMKLDKAPWSLEKVARKIAKHGSWLFVAFATGMTFVGYFYPVRELVWELATFSTGKWQILWTIFFTCATYINAGWMREQVCKYMCPYARFQSVMFDKDTLIVSYDKKRGDPRGSRKRKANPTELGLGDCIDCELCVQVCPTGIDIRNGLQYECIGCALCVDACNSVMKKMNYDPGLIRYTSEHQLGGGHTHWLRPRIIGYVLMLCTMAGVFSYWVISRIPVELTAIRDRNQLYVTTDSGAIDNIYTLHLANMDREVHEFEVSIAGIEGATIVGETRYTLDGGEVRTITLRVRAEPETLAKPSTEFDFNAVATDMPSLQATSESRFMKPL